MPTPANPQYHTFHQASSSPGDTNVHALFDVDTPALSFVVVPLPTNNDAVLVGFANPPLGPVGFEWAPFVSGRYYNLKDVYIQLADAADGVAILWIT